MEIKTGKNILSGTTFIALICLGFHVGGAASTPVGDQRTIFGEAVPWIKATLKWTRHTVKSFEAELRFGSCAFSSLSAVFPAPELSSRRDLPPSDPPPPAPLPHFLLLQALSAAGASDEDSRFLLEILGLIFPRAFPPSLLTPLARRRMEPPAREPSVAEAWEASMQALFVSLSGAARPPKDTVYPWEWSRLRREDGGRQLVSLESRRWALVPLAGNSAARVVVERGTWWGRVRSSMYRWWGRLRGWMSPLEGREGVHGVTRCLRDYLVEILWRWVEAGSRSLGRRWGRLGSGGSTASLPGRIRPVTASNGGGDTPGAR